MAEFSYDLSIIILNYRAKDYLRKSIQAVLNSQTTYSYQLIVVDNSSGDGSAEMVEAEFGGKAVLLRQPNNGFSAGNNAAIKISRGRHILLLNPDTEVAPDCLQRVLDFLSTHPKAGIVTAKLVLDNGLVDPACRRNFPNPVNSFFYLFGLTKLPGFKKISGDYQRAFAPDTQTQQVDAVNGAFELITRPCLEVVGLLDEQYFMWGEDIDWCLQAKKSGFEVWYIAEAKCLHHKGQPHKKSAKLLWIFYDSMFKYYKKNLASRYPAPVNYLVYAGIWARYTLAVILNSFKKV